MDFESKYRRLMERRYDSLEEGYRRLAKVANASTAASKALNYLIDAMDEVNPTLAIRAGTRVRDELQEAFNTLGVSVNFDFQGSAMNGTNIKKNSDIDLLVAHGSCFSAENGTHSNYPNYAGSLFEEVMDIRTTCQSELKTRYWAAKVTPGSKSIKVQGGSLERDVDVVPCNWYRNARHEQNPHKTFLGIRLWDTEKKKWIYNYPFLHNALIEVKDDASGGNLKKLIRLLKNLREDADTTIAVSSYDAQAIVYSMEVEDLKRAVSESPVAVAGRLLRHMELLILFPHLQEQVSVPNGTTKLFASAGGNLQVSELKKLIGELKTLVQEANAIGTALPNHPALTPFFTNQLYQR